MQTGLVPGAQIGMGGAGPGCFKAGTDIGKGTSEAHILLGYQ